MKVLVCPADLAGCGYYRMLFAAQHLQSQGVDIDIIWPQPGQGFNVMFTGDEMTDFILPEGTDVVVMQRSAHIWWVQAVPLLRRKGIAVVVDVDDDLSTIHPGNSAFQTYRHRSTSPFSHKNMEQVCRDATYVTVSTKSLLKIYVKHGRGQVIDNYVPERYLDISVPPNDEPLFGWMGSLDSHPADLKVLGKAVQQLTDMGHKMKVIGPGEKVAKHLYLASDPVATGRLPFLDCPTHTATLDVGMAPLEMSTFNTSKSRLKPLEYNAVGVPYVVSPREEYRRYHRESGEAGMLADTPKQWVTSIDRLMRDEVLRKELGHRGREFASTQTIEQHAWRFLEAWTRAYEIQRAGQ